MSVLLLEAAWPRLRSKFAEAVWPAEPPKRPSRRPRLGGFFIQSLLALWAMTRRKGAHFGACRRPQSGRPSNENSPRTAWEPRKILISCATRGNKPPTSPVKLLSGWLTCWSLPNEEMPMAHDHDNHGDGISRRHTLECMLWAGTGVLWTVAGGIPKSSLMGSAQAAEGGFTFLQISDSHVGFDKAANPNALGTLQEAIAKVKALPNKPAFMLHTGDITHLSKPKQFDDAAQVIGSVGLDVHYVPG